MSKHKITLKRDAISIGSKALSTDALNAISSIPNVTNASVESENESGTQVEISYTYNSNEKFWSTTEHLSKYGLERVD